MSDACPYIHELVELTYLKLSFCEEHPLPGMLADLHNLKELSITKNDVLEALVKSSSAEITKLSVAGHLVRSKQHAVQPYPAFTGGVCSTAACCKIDKFGVVARSHLIVFMAFTIRGA